MGERQRERVSERKQLPVPECLLVADEVVQVTDEKLGQIQKQQQQTPSTTTAALIGHPCLGLYCLRL